MRARLQTQFGSTAQSAHREAGGVPLPPALQKEYEGKAHIALDDVRVHRNSEQPALIGAYAFAQGSNIYLGPQQEKFLHHELTHVVQQKKGNVPPTEKRNDILLNTDKKLEDQADREDVATGSCEESIYQKNHAKKPVIQAAWIKVDQTKNDMGQLEQPHFMWDKVINGYVWYCEGYGENAKLYYERVYGSVEEKCEKKTYSEWMDSNPDWKREQTQKAAPQPHIVASLGMQGAGNSKQFFSDSASSIGWIQPRVNCSDNLDAEAETRNKLKQIGGLAPFVNHMFRNNKIPTSLNEKGKAIDLNTEGYWTVKIDGGCGSFKPKFNSTSIFSNSLHVLKKLGQSQRTKLIENLKIIQSKLSDIIPIIGELEIMVDGDMTPYLIDVAPTSKAIKRKGDVAKEIQQINAGFENIFQYLQ